MKVEIISHCWSGPNGQYAKLLAWQLWSLLQWPPQRVYAWITVCTTSDDQSANTTVRNWISRETDLDPEGELGIPTIDHFVPWLHNAARSRAMVLQRACLRNHLALKTEADVVWMADCDYLFGPGCLDALEQIAGRTEKLFFPRTTLVCRDHATGDELLSQVPQASSLKPQACVPKTEHLAIGGIQIVPGDVARQYGYCPDSKWQEPAPEGTNTIIGFGADRAYRRSLGTPGTPIDLPNLYRLRHSITGDGRVPRALRRRLEA